MIMLNKDMKNIFTKPKKTLVTHDGSFHTDDIFAAAALILYLEKNSKEFSAQGGPASLWEIIRTRDPEIIQSADYVFDVGGTHDPKLNRFDHHQVGGAGRRIPSGVEGEVVIEYAAFGLVWKKFGVELSGSEKAARMIDQKLVAPIDAGDNGFDLSENKYEVSPYMIQHVFGAMRPTWREDAKSEDEMFLKCVEIAKEVLSREIIQTRDALSAEESVIAIYKNTSDKRIILLDKHYPFQYTLCNFPEPLFVICPRTDSEGVETWGVKAVRDDPKTFKNRKNLPKLWAGVRDEELQNVTGVRDAIFCHRGLFLAVAKSKEGAIKLAQIAVES